MSAQFFDGHAMAAASVIGALLAGLAIAILAALRVRRSRRSAMLLQQQRDSEQLARFLAYNDPVTQLPNRTRFKQQASDLISLANDAGQQLDLYYCVFQLPGPPDARLIDETAGVIAARLRSMTRRSDLLARYDRCEFMLLCRRDETSDPASRMRLQLTEACQPAVSCGANDNGPVVHIGCAEYPRDGNSFRDLLVAASRAPAPERIVGRSSAAPHPQQMLEISAASLPH